MSRPVLAALSALLAISAAGPALSACVEDRVELRGDWGQAAFKVEIADDAAERSRGLMFREKLARGAGMLFVYDTPQRVAFWMHNTLIPLDMVFIGADGVVRSVHEQAVPLDDTPIPGGTDILAVLEINGGLAETYGIAPGTQVHHPAFGKAAAWPCE
ncbi:MAG: DUF192 domain-containing protein [Rhodobacteraceae bacterium]|nr:DUF192 domain-containing protein [Paracoccaceae bacterium]